MRSWLKIGLMAEWLGKGLQNLVQRFESASDLTKPLYKQLWRVFLFFTPFFTPFYHSNERIQRYKNGG